MRQSLALFGLLLAIVTPRSWAAEVKPVTPDPSKEPVAEWIWAHSPPERGEMVLFRKTFELPAGAEQIASAIIWATGDNEVRVSCNGQFLGGSDEWSQPVVLNTKSQLVAGKNVIGVAVRNTDSSAGGIAKLTVVMTDGRKIEVVTDATWKAAHQAPREWNTAAFDDGQWPAARSLGKYGMRPWGDVAAGAKPVQATAAESLKTLPGFKAELVYVVPKLTQGSWVSMTNDPKGRLYVSDQGGSLYRVTVGAKPQDTVVEQVDLPIGQAQGMLWAYDGLYVTVNGPGVKGNGSGLYRLTDTDGNDKLDKVERLVRLQGAGEHGPHALRLGPDGKIYLVAGNFTRAPLTLAPTSPHRNWAEDLLLPRNPDGGGHDPAIWAPGGWVARADKAGLVWEVLCAGLRNTYDIAFNVDGELFGYDSDMEWDTGTPWHRPIRVNHLVSGGEYGWRNGTGKWPEFYADSLGAVVNTGLGSPTGIEFGTNAKFPAKYQKALFIQDWSYGFVYAVHMTAEGASYKGTFEPFVSGKGFPVTDIVINTDGHMYMTVGGRGTQSALYRVRYEGTEPTSPVRNEPDAGAAARKIRQRLESFHGRQDPQAVEMAWEHIGSQDRALRYAARVALEWQPLEQWREKALGETRPTASIHALIALIRASAPVGADAKQPVLGPTADPVTARARQPRILEALNRLNLRTLSEEQLLDALRAYGLCFIRFGPPEGQAARTVADRVDAMYPHPNPLVMRELANLLVYLKHPAVVGKTLAWLNTARTQEDQLHAALVLRVMDTGWTLEQRKAYFSFLAHAQKNYKGGASFKKFLARIQADAEKTLAGEERVALEPFLRGLEKVEGVVKVPEPRQFVRNWQMQDLLPEIEQATKGRDFARGKAAYEAAQCASCHRFAGEGGANGPDLTGAGNRFSPTDMLEAILQPSKVVSDQYLTTELVTKGDILVGRIENEDESSVTIRTHPLAPEAVVVKKGEVKERRPSKLSMMPEGLVDILRKEEVLDLIAYVRSGGKGDDPAFAK